MDLQVVAQETPLDERDAKLTNNGIPGDSRMGRRSEEKLGCDKTAQGIQWAWLRRFWV